MENRADRTLLDLKLWTRIYEFAAYGNGLRKRLDQVKAVDRYTKNVSIVYNRKSSWKLPSVTRQTHQLRYLANAKYKFSGGTPQCSPTVTKETLPPIIICQTATPPRSPTPTPVLDNSNGKLRRPTVDVAIPLTRSKERFDAFTEKMILRPIVVEHNPTKTKLFYKTHFPLLLHSPFKENTEIEPASREENSPRRKRINAQILLLDKMIDELLAEEEFETEIKSDAFNPTTWGVA